MSAEAVDFRSFPRAPLVGAGALILISFVLVVSTRLSGGAAIAAPEAAAIAVRDLKFEDQDDGGVLVRDADSGRTIVVLARGTNGFVRATMRGLARDRRGRGLGPEIPFRLSARTDGSLTLEDPATGRSVSLQAFGQTNAGAFASFLNAPATAGVRPGAGP